MGELILLSLALAICFFDKLCTYPKIDNKNRIIITRCDNLEKEIIKKVDNGSVIVSTYKRVCRGIPIIASMGAVQARIEIVEDHRYANQKEVDLYRKTFLKEKVV